MYPLPSTSSQCLADLDKPGTCRDVTKTETTTESGEVNKEDLVNNPSSSSTSNPHNATKPNEHKLEKGGEAENQDSSQNYKGQFIPTCISPYQQNPSAFAL